ncbi:MAG: molybdenum cofactor guanylyltransferase [Lewinellaceae bacterium]|nr:molybdenum cofactor guanylyltransferase [Lewinellaceae bacterium]
MDTLSEKKIPGLQGLVLAGGRSTRMGTDKGQIAWHGKPQRAYLVELLEGLGIPACISCRPDQAAELSGFNLVLDRVADQGPLGAIYSAFQADMDVAWLVVACDMPFVDADTVRLLLRERRADMAGTAFRSPAFEDGSPDPLFAIWEPRAYPVLEKRLQAGYRCARKALLQAGVWLLEAPDPSVLANVNTPESARLIG